MPLPPTHRSVATNNAWLQGSISTMEVGPEILPCRLPAAPSSSFPSSSASCSCAPRLASHLPPANRQLGDLSGCQDPALNAWDLPFKFLGRDLRTTRVRPAVPRYSLPINLSINQTIDLSTNRAGPPELAKVGNSVASKVWPTVWTRHSQSKAACPSALVFPRPLAGDKSNSAFFPHNDSTQLNATQQQHLRGYEISFRLTTSSTSKTLPHITADRQSGSQADKKNAIRSPRRCTM